MKNTASPTSATLVGAARPPARRLSYPFLLGLSLVLLVGLTLLHIGIGSVALTPSEVVAALLNQPVEAFHRQIVWDLRLPRSLVGLLAGATLGMAGAILQAITRNPLAEPGLSGVSAGGVFLVVTGLALGLNGSILPLVALVGGLAVGLLVYTLSRTRGRSQPLRLALYGLVVGSIVGAFTSLVLVFKQEFGGTILLWMVGSLNGRTWFHWGILWPWAVVGLVLGMLSIGLANVLQLGDEMATGLGLRVEWARAGLFLVAALLTAGAVSVVGAISFVGLIGPQVARRLVGEDARKLFPLSATFSAILLLLADWLAQILASGKLPVGVLTAFLGTPFFLYLTLKKSN